MRRLALLLFLTAGTLAAQSRTWIVDASNGPGTDFTDLPAAEVAARAGDVLLVRAGRYSRLQTSKGLAVIGTGRVEAPEIAVFGLPAGQTLSIANVTLTPILFAGIQVFDCAGAVHLHDVAVPLAAGTSTSRPAALRVENSSRVTVTGGELVGVPAIRAVDSTVTVAGTIVTGASSERGPGGSLSPNGPGIEVERCALSIARAVVTGGDGEHDPAVTYEARPAIAARDSTVVVAGDMDTLLTAGQLLPGGVPIAAIEADGGTLTIDPLVRLIGFNAPPVTGTTLQIWHRVPSMLATGGVLGGPLTLEVVSRAQSLVSFLAGLPGAPQQLPFGTLFLDPGTMIDALTVFQNANELTRLTFTVPNDPALVAVPLGFQAFQWDLAVGRELALSNPAVVVLR